MSDDPVLNRPALIPDATACPGQVPGGTDAPGEWVLCHWRVPRPGAAAACAELALTLTRLGAPADDRAHAVAEAWNTLRQRLSASVTFRLINEPDHRTGVLAVDGEILSTMELPALPPASPAGRPQDAGEAERAATLLDIIADQDTALDHHRRELESTDRGLLALHTELAEQAEQLTLAGQRQRELLETEQAARAVAETARARLAFLSHVGAVLGASLDHRQVVSRLSTLLVPRYAGTAEVWLVSEHGGLERYRAAGQAGPAGTVGPSGPPYPEGAPEIVRRVQETRRPQQRPGAPGGPGTPGQASVLAVPLTSLGTVLGVLSVTPPNRPFARDDMTIVSEVAGRAAAALANALRFEQEREVAERLQHAMLTELPTGPGVECAARYLPAVTGLNVGGDWYDAYRRPDGTLVLAVGDVAGHGLAAATLMGQLRTAMRAYAMDLPDRRVGLPDRRGW